MSLLHALLRITSFRSPLLRALVPCAAAALAVQAAAAAPSILARSERFYDVSGSVTVLAVGALSLYLPALRARAAGRILELPSLLDALVPGRTGPGAAWWNWRQIVATGLAMLWTIRRECSSTPLPSLACRVAGALLPSLPLMLSAFSLCPCALFLGTGQ